LRGNVVKSAASVTSPFASVVCTGRRWIDPPMKRSPLPNGTGVHSLCVPNRKSPVLFGGMAPAERTRLFAERLAAPFEEIEPTRPCEFATAWPNV
jgi:hypothetical protein